MPSGRCPLATNTYPTARHSVGKVGTGHSLHLYQPPDPGECRRPDSAYVDQAVHRLEGAVPIAIGHDLPRHERTHKWQPLEVGGGGSVEVEWGRSGRGGIGGGW